MPGEASRSFEGPGADTPYVPAHVYPGGKPKVCPCGHHEGYHNSDGKCLLDDGCGCVGLPARCETTEDEFAMKISGLGVALALLLLALSGCKEAKEAARLDTPNFDASGGTVANFCATWDADHTRESTLGEIALCTDFYRGTSLSPLDWLADRGCPAAAARLTLAAAGCSLPVEGGAEGRQVCNVAVLALALVIDKSEGRCGGVLGIVEP